MKCCGSSSLAEINSSHMINFKELLGEALEASGYINLQTKALIMQYN
jgi:hypothetical protein